jgi:hypothetical protein
MSGLIETLRIEGCAYPGRWGHCFRSDETLTVYISFLSDSCQVLRFGDGFCPSLLVEWPYWGGARRWAAQQDGAPQPESSDGRHGLMVW